MNTTTDVSRIEQIVATGAALIFAPRPGNAETQLAAVVAAANIAIELRVRKVPDSQFELLSQMAATIYAANPINVNTSVDQATELLKLSRSHIEQARHFGD